MFLLHFSRFKTFLFFRHSKIKVRSCVLCVYAGTPLSADIVHEFQAYSHLGEKGGGGGGTLIFSNIRRPGPFLGLTFWYFVMTPKDIHKIFIPQKIFIFLKTLKGIEIQNFEPQNGASLRMNENIIVPPPPPPSPRR